MNGISNMQALLAAGFVLNRGRYRKVQPNALDGEIKTGNGNLEAMKREMENLRDAAQGARGSQAGTLGSAIELLNENTADETKEAKDKKEEEGRFDEVTLTISETEREDIATPQSVRLERRICQKQMSQTCAPVSLPNGGLSDQCI